jgi:predicted ATPase
MHNMVELVGIALSGYRSFAAGDVQFIAPLNKVNLLAGANNTGKSNVLRFAQR